MTGYDPDDDDPFDDDDPRAGSSPADPEESSVAGPADPLFGGVVVAALAGELIGPAVRKAVSKKVDDVAAQAVTDALTPEVLDQLRADADEAAQTLVHGRSGQDPAAAEAAAPRLYYGSTNEFVRDYLRHVYKRKIDGRHAFWSPQWWKSDEAIARLEALWLAWEHLRLDTTTGPSVWWRDHPTLTWGVLMSSIGPFAKEVDVKASVLEPLPHEEPPAELFPDVREAAA